MDENVDVRQRNMDAVINGLIGGATASLLIVVGGAVAVFSGLWEKMSSNYILFLWITLLSALTVGQLYLSYTVSSALMAVPTQTETGVVV